MTRKYYHSCITCPTCHEPYAGSYSELVGLISDENGKIICNCCNSRFNHLVDFSGNKKFENTYNMVLNYNKCPYSADKGKIPLYWHVAPNIIEESYIEWINERPQGTFLITWPWEEVRFIPILLSEYITRHPDSKIVVVGDYDRSLSEKSHIVVHSLPEKIHNTFFIDNPEIPNGDLKKEINSFRNEKSLLFDLRDVITVKSKLYGSRELDTWICLEKLKKCSNEQKNRIVRDYGKGSLRDIELIRKNGKRLSGYTETELESGIIDPENGKWVLQLREENQWSGKQNYNHIWIYDILNNIDRIVWCQEFLDPVTYYNIDEDVQPQSGKTHLISSHSDAGQIFRMIDKIQPDILIIENADTFIQDIRYSGPSSRALLEYLKKPVNTNLLFSTDPEKRQFYHLNSSDNALRSAGCMVHTLDSEDVLKWIGERSDQSNYLYPSPISSGIKEILQEQACSFSIQYIEVDTLTKFYDSVYQLTDLLNNGSAKDIRFYLNRVTGSPLNIIGDYSDPKYLKVYKGHFGLEITYNLLLNDLMCSADEGEIQSETVKEFKRLFTETYLPEKFCSVNPLRTKIVEKAREILENNSSAHVTVIVHFNDIRGFERLIRDEKLIPEDLLPHFNVSGWKGLTSKEALIEKGQPHYVISSQYPSLSYNLRKSGVREFIFISDQKGLQEIKEIISRRLLDVFAHPIFSPDEGGSMPPLIHEALKATDVPAPERVAEIYDDIDDEEIRFSIRKQSQNIRQKTTEETDLGINGIESGDEAFLCIDNQNRGIFIPIGQSVMISNKGFFTDIDTDNRRSDAKIIKDLTHSEIVLGKSGIYYSFKSIFFRYMIKKGTRVTFRRTPYSWKGFMDFFETSILWIHLIEQAAERLAEKYSCDVYAALTFISARLTAAGITAQEPSTVIGWCLNYEDITLESGTYRIYKTEHPFRKNDLKVIFETLNSIIPGVIPDKCDPDEIFAAALCMQDLRLKILKNTSDKIDTTYQDVRRGLAKEMENIISEAELFSPTFVRRVTVANPVRPMRIYQNYNEFL